MTHAEQTPDLHACGQRIEQLLEASAATGPLAQERSEELVGLVAELYGAGLERVFSLLHDAGALTEEILDLLVADELVSGLLLVHGLHPYGVEERVQRALDGVRPYLGSHGGDVHLVGVLPDDTGRPVVHLRLVGSCDGCPSSAATLSLAVEGAVLTAAPEVARIEVEQSTAPSVIPAEALTSRLHELGPEATWLPVAAPTANGVQSLQVGGLPVLICRFGSSLYAYRDGCPTCARSMAGASLERALGTALGTAVLTCPGCRSHFDVHLAGAGTSGTLGHLDPLPLLERDGVVEIAVPRQVPA
jgi:Fe-S cluster biogenesis protein NfuA